MKRCLYPLIHLAGAEGYRLDEEEGVGRLDVETVLLRLLAAVVNETGGLDLVGAARVDDVHIILVAQQVGDD